LIDFPKRREPLMSDDTVGRAFDLARSGGCHNLDDIRRQLKAEGYASIAEHFSGPTIKKQLTAAIRKRTTLGQA